MANIKEYHKPPVSIVDPQERSWTVKDDSVAPRMSFEAQTVWVPLDDSQVSIDIRAHEMAHVWETPEDAYKQLEEFPGDLVNAVEDGRINSHLEACGVRAPDYSEHPIYDEEKVLANMERHPMIAAMMRYCAEGTGWKWRAQEFLEELYPDDAAWINMQAERLSVPGADFSATAGVVRETYEAYCTPPPPEPEEDEESETGEGGEPQDESEAGKSESTDDNSEDDSSGESEDEESDDESSEGSGSGEGDGSEEGTSQGSGGSGEADGEDEGSGNQPGDQVEDTSDGQPDGRPSEDDTAGGGSSSSDGSSSNEESTASDTPPPPPRPRPETILDPEEAEVDKDAAPWKATEALKDTVEDEGPEPEIAEPENGWEIEIEGNDEAGAAAEGIKGMWNIRKIHPQKLSPGKNRWSPVRDKEMPLTQALPRAHRAAKRGEFYGRSPRYPQRFYTDRKIFARKQGGNEYPGTLLIDVSGTMAVNGKEIGRVLDKYPLAEVRDYSACHVGDFGNLRIIAKDGKRLTDEELDSGRACSTCRNNGIDGPALRWLSTQPRPRFWISDGLVNGAGERMTQNLIDECVELCRKHRIIRVDSVEEFLRKYC